MDETDTPQRPEELFFILAALADEGVDIQTVAPRFSGRFNKGVEYVGDVGRFEREFDADVAALRAAQREFGLDSSLKLSVHSGSDKFAIYPAIRRVLERTGAGSTSRPPAPRGSRSSSVSPRGAGRDSTSLERSTAPRMGG